MTQFAYTAPTPEGGGYPEFVNIHRQGDVLQITVRSPFTKNGISGQCEVPIDQIDSIIETLQAIKADIE